MSFLHSIAAVLSACLFSVTCSSTPTDWQSVTLESLSPQTHVASVIVSFDSIVQTFWNSVSGR